MSQILRNLRRNCAIVESVKNVKKILGLSRRLSTQEGLREEDAEEVKIPVPWGHIAGKWWGRSEGKPIIGIHGWQDNAGSFDRLIPCLDVSNFLAIDLPGHGLSSHYPRGKVYTFHEYIYSVRRVVDHFKFDKITLMGHSLGSAIAFAYTATHKNDVECLINLECGRYLLLAYADDFPSMIAKGVEKILEYDDTKEDEMPGGYTYDKAIESFIVGSMGSVDTVESASKLFKRGTKPCESSNVETTGKKMKRDDLSVFVKHELTNVDEKSKSELLKKVEFYKEKIEELSKSAKPCNDNQVYRFTKDPRVKMLQFGMFNLEVWEEMSKHIICPVLSIQAKDGYQRFGSEELYKKGNEIVRKHSKHFEHLLIEGNHHFHLNTPENVAPAINEFLKQFHCSV